MHKVLQAMAGAAYGGAEAFFVRLVLALHKAGLPQRAVIRANSERAAILRDGGVDTVELPFGGIFDIRSRLRFKKAIKEFGPDIVVTWMNRATQFCPNGDYIRAARLGGYYDLKYYKGCNHLIGNTPDIVDYMRKGKWPAEKSHYLPNFVSEDRAPPISRKDFYTPQNAPLILALGRLHQNKGFDVLFKAVSNIPEAYLWLAGDGPLREELETLAQQVGVKPRVRFLGWRNDIAALFATADMFVCPSRHEPLGNVVIEAWAHAKPVIAADSMGPGTLIHHEENGLLFNVDDVQALMAAIRWLIKEPDFAAKIAINGRKSYEENFTMKKVVTDYLNFFDRIVAQKCAELPES